MLPERNVYMRQRLGFVAHNLLAHIAHHPYDFARLRIASALRFVQTNLLANSIAAGPQLIGRELIDDGNLAFDSGMFSTATNARPRSNGIPSVWK